MSRVPSVYCCTITPFDAQQRLDEPGLQFLVERLARAGVGAFVGTSSPGEGFALTLAETERLYGVTKEAMAGRQEVRVMGVEPRRADETYELIKIAESVGMDAMQLYCLDLGHGSQPMPAELELFFRTNLERMNIPAVLSTHFMLGYMIPLDMLGRLMAGSTCTWVARSRRCLRWSSADRASCARRRSLLPCCAGLSSGTTSTKTTR
jgi:4-hydroxy-tetrahydrodipicolinate synthase